MVLAVVVALPSRLLKFPNNRACGRLFKAELELILV